MAKFPPLPEGHRFLRLAGGGTARKLTEHQLRARDLEIWRMAMEAAAKVCKSVETKALSAQSSGAMPGSIEDQINVNIRMTALLLPECAAAIRALPEPSHQ